jgi:hypothetical protein
MQLERQEPNMYQIKERCGIIMTKLTVEHFKAYWSRDAPPV